MAGEDRHAHAGGRDHELGQAQILRLSFLYFCSSLVSALPSSTTERHREHVCGDGASKTLGGGTRRRAVERQLRAAVRRLGDLLGELGHPGEARARDRL